MDSPTPQRARRRLLAALALAPMMPAALAQSGERKVPVTLDGSTAQRFDDTINEFEIVSYMVSLRQGQSVQISLASSNASNCFDIHAPNASKPVYVGSESGNEHVFRAPAAGEYQIKVFLLRFAARDGQSAQYTLELKLTES